MCLHIGTQVVATHGPNRGVVVGLVDIVVVRDSRYGLRVKVEW